MHLEGSVGGIHIRENVLVPRASVALGVPLHEETPFLRLSQVLAQTVRRQRGLEQTCLHSGTRRAPGATWAEWAAALPLLGAPRDFQMPYLGAGVSPGA